jgi:hypothetical protein
VLHYVIEDIVVRHSTISVRTFCTGHHKEMIMNSQVAPDSALLARMKSPLVVDTLAENLTGESPQRLIGDKAYDSDPLDA